MRLILQYHVRRLSLHGSQIKIVSFSVCRNSDTYTAMRMAKRFFTHELHIITRVSKPSIMSFYQVWHSAFISCVKRISFELIQIPHLWIYMRQWSVISRLHWGRLTHICVSKLTIIGSDNGLSPGRRQAIIWTNAGMLIIRTWGTNFSEILGEIHSFSFSKMHLKMSSAKSRLFGLGLNELRSSSR